MYKLEKQKCDNCKKKGASGFISGEGWTYCNTCFGIKLKRLYVESQIKAEGYCGNERPSRKTLCQLKKGHKGSCRAVIFWEKR